MYMSCVCVCREREKDRERLLGNLGAVWRALSLEREIERGIKGGWGEMGLVSYAGPRARRQHHATRVVPTDIHSLLVNKLPSS